MPYLLKRQTCYRFIMWTQKKNYKKDKRLVSFEVFAFPSCARTEGSRALSSSLLSKANCYSYDIPSVHALESCVTDVQNCPFLSLHSFCLSSRARIRTHTHNVSPFCILSLLFGQLLFNLIFSLFLLSLSMLMNLVCIFVFEMLCIHNLMLLTVSTIKTESCE